VNLGKTEHPEKGKVLLSSNRLYTDTSRSRLMDHYGTGFKLYMLKPTAMVSTCSYKDDTGDDKGVTQLLTSMMVLRNSEAHGRLVCKMSCV